MAKNSKYEGKIIHGGGGQPWYYVFQGVKHMIRTDPRGTASRLRITPIQVNQDDLRSLPEEREDIARGFLEGLPPNTTGDPIKVFRNSFKSRTGRKPTAEEEKTYFKEVAGWSRTVNEYSREYLDRKLRTPEKMDLLIDKLVMGQGDAGFLARSVADSPEAIIISQFQDWTGRSPSEAELRPLVNSVEFGSNIDNILDSIAESDEARQFGNTPAGAARQVMAMIPRPPIPYDEAHPFSFDEVLARSSAEAQYGPFYDEMLNDFLEVQGIRRERGVEDLDTQKEDIQEDLDFYLQSIGIAEGRVKDEFSDYKARQDIAKERIGEDAARRREELGTTTKRLKENQDFFMDEVDKERSRLLEDYGRRLEEGEISLERIGEEEESYLGREAREWEYLIDRVQNQQASRGVLTSGIGGRERSRLSTERESALDDYLRGVSDRREDINRGIEELGLEKGRGEEDIMDAIVGSRAQLSRDREDLRRQEEEILLAEQRGTSDIERDLVAEERRFGGNIEDLIRQSETARKEATRGTEAGETSLQRLMEDIRRESDVGTRDVTRTREAAIEGGVETRRGEQLAQHESGRKRFEENRFLL